MKSTTDLALLDRHLAYLCLSFIRQNCQSLATEAARKELSHLDYLAQLAEGEASLRQDRAVARRIKAARFPLIKTLDSFRWDWPKKINRLQIQDLFRLQFIEDKANVIFLGLVGVGKSHLAILVTPHGGGNPFSPRST
jgi:DNA replication protein DnaC